MAGMDVPALSESGSDSGSDSEYEEEMIILAAQAAVLAASTSLDFFIAQELDDSGQRCVDHDSGVRDYLKTIAATLPTCSELLPISLLPNLRSCVK